MGMGKTHGERRMRHPICAVFNLGNAHVRKTLRRVAKRST
jgi:hypothetical protein